MEVVAAAQVPLAIAVNGALSSHEGTDETSSSLTSVSPIENHSMATITQELQELNKKVEKLSDQMVQINQENSQMHKENLQTNKELLNMQKLTMNFMVSATSSHFLKYFVLYFRSLAQ
jgi:TolA-binding protein